MIDLHCHVLPGIDDGPTSIEESLALARAAVAAGTGTVVATSHVSPVHRNTAERLARLVAEVQARLDAEGIELELRTGAEIAMRLACEIEPAEEAPADTRRRALAADRGRSRRT